MASEHTSERLTRLLALVTFLADRPGEPVADVAAHFGVTESQVIADVNLLWVSGTPGYLPDDLLDFSYDALERGFVTLTNARGMERPLRLGPTEAIALLAALRSIERMPGGPGEAAVASVAAKLSAAAGEAAAAAASAVDVRLARSVATDLLSRLRDAVLACRVVHLRYVSAADVVTERDVDPGELLHDGERWFLRAWCRSARDVRHFRLDRILEARVLDEPATHRPEPAQEAGRGAEPDLTAADLVVTLELATRARWVAEGLPVETMTELEPGWVEVRLRVVSETWLRSLVLALGPDVRRVDPPWLARAVADAAGAALAAYERLA
jgi:proteasome accessory factor C